MSDWIDTLLLGGYYEPNKNKLKWRMGLMMSIELQASIIKCIMEKAI